MKPRSYFIYLSLFLITSFLCQTSVYAENLSKRLDGNVVLLKEGKVKKAKEVSFSNKKYVALYFSAHWCPPCRNFTPKLVNFYNEMKKKHDNFEIVFVSNDRSEKEMEKYMEEANMPWPAVRFKKINKTKLEKDYSGKGIPCLVVIDEKGTVLSHSYVNGKFVGPSKVMRDLKELLEK